MNVNKTLDTPPPFGYDVLIGLPGQPKPIIPFYQGIKIMLTYQEALVKTGGNLSLDEYKRLYQEQCRREVKAGIASKESMQLFTREIIRKVKVEYRDVDYD